MCGRNCFSVKYDQSHKHRLGDTNDRGDEILGVDLFSGDEFGEMGDRLPNVDLPVIPWTIQCGGDHNCVRFILSLTLFNSVDSKLFSNEKVIGYDASTGYNHSVRCWGMQDVTCDCLSDRKLFLFCVCCTFTGYNDYGQLGYVCLCLHRCVNDCHFQQKIIQIPLLQAR